MAHTVALSPVRIVFITSTWVLSVEFDLDVPIQTVCPT